MCANTVVIDMGTCADHDPDCGLVIAWHKERLDRATTTTLMQIIKEKIFKKNKRRAVDNAWYSSWESGIVWWTLGWKRVVSARNLMMERADSDLVDRVATLEDFLIFVSSALRAAAVRLQSVGDSCQQSRQCWRLLQ